MHRPAQSHSTFFIIACLSTAHPSAEHPSTACQPIPSQPVSLLPVFHCSSLHNQSPRWPTILYPYCQSHASSDGYMAPHLCNYQEVPIHHCRKDCYIYVRKEMLLPVHCKAHHALSVKAQNTAIPQLSHHSLRELQARSHNHRHIAMHTDMLLAVRVIGGRLGAQMGAGH